MTRNCDPNSDLNVAAEQTVLGERRAVLEAELRAATREYEDELLAMFDRLAKCHSVEAEGGPLRHHYWNGKEWVEYDLNDPPLWAVENIDLEHLAAPGPWGDSQPHLPSH